MSYRNWKQHESIGPDGLHIPREQLKGTLETWENIGNRCHSGKAAILRESRLHWKSHDSLGFLQNIGKQAKPAIRQGLQSHDSSRVLLLRWGSAEIVKGKHSYTTTTGGGGGIENYLFLTTLHFFSPQRPSRNPTPLYSSRPLRPLYSSLPSLQPPDFSIPPYLLP